MTVTRNDRTADLDRARALKMARSTHAYGRGNTAGFYGWLAGSRAATPLDRLRALAGRDELSDDDLKRALVRGLLTQQLGDAVGNDPAFEHVAGEVLRILGKSDAGRTLLDRALQDLTAR